MPHIHLSLMTNGDVQYCCMSTDYILDNNGKKFNIKSDSLKTIQQSSYLKTIQQKSFNDEIIKGCEYCVNAESQGIRSKRMIENDKWSTGNGLQYVELKFGPKCHLKCTICSPKNSTEWISDWNKLYNSNYKYAGSNWYKSKQFWDDFIESLRDIKKINFAGGEPLLSEEHTLLIEHLITSDNAKHIELKYNTNGIDIDQSWIDKWNCFKKVTIGYSIDGIEKQNEYMRYGSNWDNTLKQLLFVRDNQSDVIDLYAAVTLSLLNVYDIQSTINFFKENNIKYNITLLYGPVYLAVSSLPPHKKEQLKQDFPETLKYIHNQLDIDTKTDRTIKYLTDLDKIRGTDFRKTFPFLSDL